MSAESRHPEAQSVGGKTRRELTWNKCFRLGTTHFQKLPPPSQPIGVTAGNNQTKEGSTSGLAAGAGWQELRKRRLTKSLDSDENFKP